MPVRGARRSRRPVNLAAEHGADMAMIFPRDLGELQQAPKLSKIPLVSVVSRGDRDNRPVASAAQLADMGYKVALDALLYLLASFHFNKRALAELGRPGFYRPQPRGMSSLRGTTSKALSVSTSSTRSRKRPSKKGNGASGNRDVNLTI
jgi:hypothetical protein